MNVSQEKEDDTMRVLHILNNGGVSGSERHVEELASAQRMIGDRVGVLCMTGEFPAGSLRSRGVDVVVDPQVSPDSTLSSGTLAAARKIAMKRIRDFDPEVVHVHSRWAGTIVVPPALLEGVPVVYTHHSLDCSPFLLAASVQGLQFPVIAVSEASAERLRLRLGTSSHITCVPNGVRPTTPLADAEVKNGSRQTIALVGSLIPVKGIDIVILALRLIYDIRGVERTPTLNVFGQGWEECTLRILAEQLGVEDLVRFRGEKLGAVNAQMGADAIIIASREESAPLVLLEAMHAGIPVIASSVGGIPEILPDASFGLTFAAGSYRELSARIMDTIDDPSAAASRARNAQERYWTEYTAEVMAQRTRAVYAHAQSG
ncbi:glycosyltransferase family 4 protein [Nonomuraea sp. NPDC049714]|uniref:glycosyltransferase family 4 protein n=1 Tax=Nonomuraea sp. NPDC049714 TaxID=3364357 RepID=UPI0037A87163